MVLPDGTPAEVTDKLGRAQARPYAWRCRPVAEPIRVLGEHVEPAARGTGPVRTWLLLSRVF